MVTTTKERNTAAIVEEELRRINAPVVKDRLRNFATAMIALGVVEIIAGLLAISLPFFAGTLFTVFLGVSLAVAGIVQIVHSIGQRAWGRLVLGILAAAAGVIVVANPVASLAFLTLLAGIYLIASGIVRLAVSGGSGWDVFGGILGIVLGILILAGWPGTSLFTIGVFIGAYILVSGITSISIASRLRRALA